MIFRGRTTSSSLRVRGERVLTRPRRIIDVTKSRGERSDNGLSYFIMFNIQTHICLRFAVGIVLLYDLALTDHVYI